MAKLTFTVSLDDDWAAKYAKRMKDPELLRRLASASTITKSGRVIDRNGNTIGTLERSED